MRGSELVDRWQVAANHEPRAAGATPKLIVLHYTGMANGQAAVDWLCNPESRVSCHYLVDFDGTIVQMVDEDRRAWHAGQSEWFGEMDVNSKSIGIEIQNLGHVAGCPAFPAVQIQRVALLCLDIMGRYALLPEQVVAHSDVAPGRKIDPGEAFDWQYLAGFGVGTMVCPSSDDARDDWQSTPEGVDVERLQHRLSELGYGIPVTGVYDNRTRVVLEAFQRRYRPSRVDGRLDLQTDDILDRLRAVRPNLSACRTA